MILHGPPWSSAVLHGPACSAEGAALWQQPDAVVPSATECQTRVRVCSQLRALLEDGAGKPAPGTAGGRCRKASSGHCWRTVPESQLRALLEDGAGKPAPGTAGGRCRKARSGHCWRTVPESHARSWGLNSTGTKVMPQQQLLLRSPRALMSRELSSWFNY